MQLKHIAIAVLMSVSMGSAMARTAEIYVPPRIFLPLAAEASPEQLRNRIIAAAQALGWIVVKDEPGRLDLHFDKQGKHQVNIAVAYEAAAYQIEYLTA